MKFKYIIVEVDERELPLIFSSFLSHEDVLVTGMDGVKSAGYCELGPKGKWIASGQSVSLRLFSRPQDSEILNAQANSAGSLTSFTKC